MNIILLLFLKVVLTLNLYQFNFYYLYNYIGEKFLNWIKKETFKYDSISIHC